MEGKTLEHLAEADLKDRIAMLDGWRALSIILVLVGHWFPIGPKDWHLNSAVPTAGMALFFTLSGFLITRLLLRDTQVAPFLVRRLFRIVPLAWTAMLVLAIAVPANRPDLISNLLFVSNLPPQHLMLGGNHLWSLCVEVQFYILVALIALIAGYRGLYILPVIALAVTALRIQAAEPVSIVTWHRVDEILAGATLALVLSRIGRFPFLIQLPTWTPLGFGLLLLASSHPLLQQLNYARPYFAAAAIGTSLFSAPELVRRVWLSRPASYIAQASYAIYVVHGMLTPTWLGTGATSLERYAKRPLLVAATFIIAHLSTFHFERRWILKGKEIANRFRRASQTSHGSRSSEHIT